MPDSTARKSTAAMGMLVAIVGRPNVGKSTLFNRLSRSRRALVDDEPGVTRDRNYATVAYEDRHFSIVDTGGLVPGDDQDRLVARVTEQALLAVEEADLVLFLTDAREGLTPVDKEIYRHLRKSRKPVVMAANKVDGPEHEALAHDFYALGVDQVLAVSAAHGYGIPRLMETLASFLPPQPRPEEPEEETIRLAVVGRPNVGKSSLVNCILGEERLVVSEQPGTTRDTIDTLVQIKGRKYILTDTAGIRRKSRVSRKLEKYSIIKALKGIEHSHIALVLMDAVEGVTEQDVKIAGYAYQRDRAVIFLINKWDLLSGPQKDANRFREEIRLRMKYLAFAPLLTISALQGKRVARIFDLAQNVFIQFCAKVPTSHLNKMLAQATDRHSPPRHRGQAVKLKYITQISTMPPTFAVFANRPEGVHFSYRRYLVNQIREHFNLDLTPIKLVFKPKS